MFQRVLLRVTILTVSGLLLIACGSKVNLNNYSKLKVAQPYAEVKEILGDPAHCDETIGVRTCVWGDDKHNISVRLISDKVLSLSAHNLK